MVTDAFNAWIHSTPFQIAHLHLSSLYITRLAKYSAIILIQTLPFFLSFLLVHLLIQSYPHMGPLYCSINASSKAFLLLSLVILPLSSFQAFHSAEGRREVWKLQEVPNGRAEEEMVMVEAMIGSRPPRCEGRCISCGHCEAVQMPVASQEQKGGIGHLFKVTTSKFDDSSNYKPLNWKCKCGDIIFNP